MRKPHRSRTLLIVVSGAAAVLIACWTVGRYPGKVAAKQLDARVRAQLADLPQQTDDVLEVMYLHFFQEDGFKPSEPSGACYLAVVANQVVVDPGERLLRRFSGNGVPVRPFSNAIKAETSEFIDKETGVPGIVLYVSQVRWRNPNQVYVWGGYYSGNLSSQSNLYLLEKVQGKWRVIQAWVISVS